MSRVAPLLLPIGALLLAGCHAAPLPPGAVSADEADALNRAADMLDANSEVADNATANGE